MSELAASRFTEFFHALWGYDPFPWQAALATRVLTDRTNPWPVAIAAPTAAGKTACIDIAVFAVAASAGSLPAAPRRIWFVVDRRVIVDEAYERAKALSRHLRDARNGIVAEVAERLRALAGGGIPLAAHLLRGGVYRDDAWARSPFQPAVIASTVDQIGSRLLFRAYGRSARVWPIHAGLAGNDSLILLDEAHCAKPFLETLQAITRYRTLAKEPLPAPFRAVILSATPPGEISDRHELAGHDHHHPVLGPRLRATKPTQLLPPIAAKGKNKEKFAQALAETAQNMIDPERGRNAVVVFVNRVATARQVYGILDSKERTHDLVLLTGRMRPIDKDDTVRSWLTLLSTTNSATRRLDRPVIVVTTQTLEVGANLDFDALVSECASLDAVRQRMGRLNRGGRDEVSTRAALLVCTDQAENSNDDPVYGAALANTWQWLGAVANVHGEVDFGVEAFASLLPAENILAALNAPARNAPVLLPAHLNALVQTAPVPCPSPDPAVFLHGPESGAADVLICWRADIGTDVPQSAIETITLCPPTATECLAVPFARFRAWLAGEADDNSDGGDVEGVRPENAGRGIAGNPRAAVRWLGREEAEMILGPERLRPGDVIVLPTDGGGLEELGHHPPGAPLDYGDRSQFEARGRAVLRLHPGPMNEWPTSCQTRDRLSALAADTTRREETHEEWVQDLRDALRELAAEPLPNLWGWLCRAAAALAADPKLDRMVVDHPLGGLVLRGSRRLRPDTGDSFTDEDDPSASGTARVELADHLRRVGERAKIHGVAAGIPAQLVDALACAGATHDLGKADPRFQSWLHGGRPAIGPLLAKSAGLPQHPRAARRARERAGYPEGGRHELLSVRLLEAAGLNPDLEPDLVRYLLASHHGYGRPFAPVVMDPDQVTVQHPFIADAKAESATDLERLDSGVAERFWRLTHRFGWWGIAWLEAMVRLADHIESEEEQQ
ncbi:MAG: type I-U CRISPR-associated helicase/endonuclease Cas3 [Thermodesulfobacteriota bacterium]